MEKLQPHNHQTPMIPSDRCRKGGGRTPLTAYFAYTKFESGASFQGIAIQEKADFVQACFRNISFFNGAQFWDAQNSCLTAMNNARFESPVDFSNVHFSTFPILEGAMLHEKCTFSTNEKFWPKPSAQADETLSQAKASCAVIRHALGKQGLPEAEHFFFRREMGFAARIGGWWERLPYRAFGVLSDFGFSIRRPALWLLGSALGFGVVIHALIQWAISFPRDEATRTLAEVYHPFAAFALSVSNLVNFLGFQKTWFPTAFLEGLPPSVRVLSALETIWGVLLLFFLLLGFRTRFRMR